MNLTIFGATGGVGRCLVEQALAQGHEVTAVVRDPVRLAVPARQGLRIITADVMDPGAIVPAVTGAEAVLTSVGPRGTGPTTVITDSVRGIVAAMRKAGISRLLMVSGSIVADQGESPYLRYLIKPIARRTFLRNVCADMRLAEAEITVSGLEWTIMRPPRLTGKPASGGYRRGVDSGVRHALTVSRADLADCMLALIDDQAAVGRHVAVAGLLLA